MAINISHALTVDGWLTEIEMIYLAERAEALPKHSRVAEIGSWLGRSTCALATNSPGRVYAVDTWLGSPEHVPMLQDKPHDWLYTEFQRNIEPCWANISAYRMPSLEAAQVFTDYGLKFDLIFIDANHSYKDVAADIRAWTPLLTPGGILCGHDWDEKYWPGVVRAVRECVPKFRVVPDTTIWSTEGCE